MTVEIRLRDATPADLAGRPAAFVKLLIPDQDPEHYWGAVPAGLRALNIWLGEASDLGRGYGTRIMTQALDRCFRDPSVTAVLLDPQADNTGRVGCTSGWGSGSWSGTGSGRRTASCTGWSGGIGTRELDEGAPCSGATPTSCPSRQTSATSPASPCCSPRKNPVGFPVVTHIRDPQYYLWVPLNVAATAFASAGPGHYDLATGSLGPYAELMNHRHAVNPEGELVALRVQDLLLEAYFEEASHTVEGIAATPSPHVAMPFRFTLALRGVSRALVAGFIAFGVLIFLGSVHLGWDYAVGGYFAIVGAAVVSWGGEGGRTSRVRHCRGAHAVLDSWGLHFGAQRRVMPWLRWTGNRSCAGVTCSFLLPSHKAG